MIQLPELKAEKSNRRQCMVTCCICGERFDANDEGVSYGNGKDAHESCHDSQEFQRANAADFRD